jgi:hypothetical protein
MDIKFEDLLVTCENGRVQLDKVGSKTPAQNRKVIVGAAP